MGKRFLALSPEEAAAVTGGGKGEGGEFQLSGSKGTTQSGVLGSAAV